MPWDENEIESLQPIVTFESTLAFPNEHEAVLSGVYSGANALKRYLGCIILMHLPEKGVDEAFDWLKDTWQFYAHPPVGQQAVPALIGPPMKAKGKALVLRPALELTEE
jgi:hypothetical protein